MKGWHFQKLLLHVNVLLNAVYYGDVFYKPYGLFSHLSSTEAIKCVLGGWAFRESRSVGAALTVKTWGVCVCVCVYRFGCRPADRHPSTHQTPVSQTPDGGKELQHQGQVWTRTRTRIGPAAGTGSDSAADVLLSVSSGFWMKFCRKWFIWCRRKSVWVGLCNTVTHARTHTDSPVALSTVERLHILHTLITVEFLLLVLRVHCSPIYHLPHCQGGNRNWVWLWLGPELPLVYVSSGCDPGLGWLHWSCLKNFGQWNLDSFLERFQMIF